LKIICAKVSFNRGRYIANDFGKLRQQDASAIVERRKMKLVASGFQAQWRIRKPDVPSRVPPRVLVAGCEQDSTASIQTVDDRVDRIVDGNLFDRSMNLNPASRQVSRFAGHKKTPRELEPGPTKQKGRDLLEGGGPKKTIELPHLRAAPLDLVYVVRGCR
jgi:hypothetical protein